MAISLVMGVFLLPLPEARANFLTSLFNDARASTDITVPVENISNSQNMALLQANSFSIPIQQDKNAKDTGINQDADVNILSDNALLPATGPLGISDGTTGGGDFSFDQVSVYTVRKGDTISQIAGMFDVSADTILAANDMKKGDKLVEGDTLFILPISGIEHTVTKGQTLKGIAVLYKIDVSEIIFYNGIAENDTLAIGDKLIIPGAEMLDEGGDKPSPNLGASAAKDQNYYATHPITNLAGYFINPVPTGRKTQGLHGPGKRGIDIGAPTGTPIYASASGVVIIAKSGCVVGKKTCGGGYGNMTVIQHPNGTKTLYGHMSKLNTKTGATISQGEVLGYVGSTGRSTGPHIHFEVFNARNPGADWSWKQ